jgi:2-amino-4-hydroxy-6-hydroxymethyldihydropteridine diphosphokinase
MTHQTAFIGLGANLGQPSCALHQAYTTLLREPGIVEGQLSRLYASAPVDANGPDYVNAVARLHTTLTPDQMLVVLQRIEADHGRERRYRNAPRTLDLDLLLYGNQTLETPDLKVPHPRMHLRAFVLKPLLELTETDFELQGKPLTHWLALSASQDCEPLTRH